MKTKFFLFAMVAVFFAACNSNEPTRKFVGTWDPVPYEGYDLFVITADSIKAIDCDTKEEHYQCHYKMLRDNVAKLERCWLIEESKNHDSSDSDWQPEQYFYAEVKMYIDKNGYLIIKPFNPGSVLSQTSPNYAELKLKRHENK